MLCLADAFGLEDEVGLADPPEVNADEAFPLALVPLLAEDMIEGGGVYGYSLVL